MHGLANLAPALLTCATCFWPQQSRAQDWSYSITPYIWTPSVQSRLRVGGNAPVEGSSSVLDLLDGAFLVYGEANRGAWSLVGEFNYLNLRNEFGATPNGSTAEWGLSGNMASLVATYAVADGPGGRLEALAGLRGWDIETDTRILGISASANSRWVDPIMGFRFALPIAEKVDFTGLATIGGFGIGSDRQWEALGQIKWSVSDLIALSVGYRHLYLDFKDTNVITDLELSGPFVALGFRF